MWLVDEVGVLLLEALPLSILSQVEAPIVTVVKVHLFKFTIYS